MYSGILTGCDESQEWLLKWWWENYSKHNSYPVTFIDFGMSKSAHNWCKKRGFLIQIATQELSPPKTERWDTFLPKEERKNVWFYKPLAMLHAPYTLNLWIDLDCKVKENLYPLFNFPFKECAIGVETPGNSKLEKKGKLTPQDAVSYNTGVVLYHKRCSLIAKWAEKSLLESDESYGDQDILSRLIFEKQAEVTLLPDKFNFLYPYKDNEENAIYHYATPIGKLMILEEMRYGT